METIYRVEHISYRYQKDGRNVFDDVSLELRPGQIISILGANGAGKSTLLNCMAGMFHPLCGEIYLAGRPLRELSYTETARNVAYVQQIHVPAFSYTVLQFVLMGRAPHIPFFERPKAKDEEIARDALRKIGVEHLADKPYTEISGGERQQCVIARAVAQQPGAILFDEPVAHLDFGNQMKILGLIKSMAAEGYGVIMTTHDPNHALLLGGQAAVLDGGGKLVCGPVDEVISEDALRGLYGADVKVVYIDELGRRAALHAGI